MPAASKSFAAACPIAPASQDTHHQFSQQLPNRLSRRQDNEFEFISVTLELRKEKGFSHVAKLQSAFQRPFLSGQIFCRRVYRSVVFMRIYPIKEIRRITLHYA